MRLKCFERSHNYVLIPYCCLENMGFEKRDRALGTAQGDRYRCSKLTRI
ncbi:MAG TPA: hypothetical protein V6C90_23210 [Coleofasciculaceae cyanobacterium]